MHKPLDQRWLAPGIPWLLGLAFLLHAEVPPAQRRLEGLLAVNPTHGGLMVALAKVHLQAGDTASAGRWLERALATGIDIDPATLPGLVALSAQEPFTSIRKRLEGRPPIRASRLWARLAESDLEPEGIAADPVSGHLFLGSIAQRKIIVLERPDRTRDFVSSGQDGLLGVVGLRVDSRRSHLWACSNGVDTTGQAHAGIFVFQLPSGRLLRRVWLPHDGEKHFLNDLVVAPDGTAFITDSETGWIYRLTPQGRSLEPFHGGPSQFRYLNGIACDPQGAALFISDFLHGLSRLEIATRRCHPITHAADVPTLGIDGLYLAQGDLLAIQNANGQERIVRYRLDAGQTAITAMQVLERGHAAYQVPMTGALRGNHFLFVAYGPAVPGALPVGTTPSALTVVMALPL